MPDLPLSSLACWESRGMILRLTPEAYAAFINRQRTGKSPPPRRAEEIGFQRSVLELMKGTHNGNH